MIGGAYSRKAARPIGLTSNKASRRASHEALPSPTTSADKQSTSRPAAQEALNTSSVASTSTLRL